MRSVIETHGRMWNHRIQVEIRSGSGLRGGARPGPAALGRDVAMHGKGTAARSGRCLGHEGSAGR